MHCLIATLLFTGETGSSWLQLLGKPVTWLILVILCGCAALLHEFTKKHKAPIRRTQEGQTSRWNAASKRPYLTTLVFIGIAILCIVGLDMSPRSRFMPPPFPATETSFKKRLESTKLFRKGNWLVIADAESRYLVVGIRPDGNSYSLITTYDGPTIPRNRVQLPLNLTDFSEPEGELLEFVVATSDAHTEFDKRAEFLEAGVDALVKCGIQMTTAIVPNYYDTVAAAPTAGEELVFEGDLMSCDFEVLIKFTAPLDSAVYSMTEMQLHGGAGSGSDTLLCTYERAHLWKFLFMNLEGIRSIAGEMLSTPDANRSFEFLALEE